MQHGQRLDYLVDIFAIPISTIAITLLGVIDDDVCLTTRS